MADETPQPMASWEGDIRPQGADAFLLCVTDPLKHKCVDGPAFSLRSILVPEKCFVLKTREMAVGWPAMGPGVSRIASGLLEASEKVESCPLWHPQDLLGLPVASWGDGETTGSCGGFSLTPGNFLSKEAT